MAIFDREKFLSIANRTGSIKCIRLYTRFWERKRYRTKWIKVKHHPYNPRRLSKREFSWSMYQILRNFI